jgi:hypothetical protein
MPEVEETIYPDQPGKPSKEDQRDIDNCTKEVMDTLLKYNCEIAVAFLITGYGNNPQVQIVKKV